MRRKIIISVLLLVIADALTEGHSMLYALDPNVAGLEISPFWASSMKISLQWFVKMAADDFLLIVVFFVMAKALREVSYTLFIVAYIYFFKHFISLVLFFLNYRQTYWVYWILVAAAGGALLTLVFPEKKQGHYKSMI